MIRANTSSFAFWNVYDSHTFDIIYLSQIYFLYSNSRTSLLFHTTNRFLPLLSSPSTTTTLLFFGALSRKCNFHRNKYCLLIWIFKWPIEHETRRWRGSETKIANIEFCENKDDWNYRHLEILWLYRFQFNTTIYILTKHLIFN